MMHSDAGTFAAVFAALYSAHQLADHWVQTHHQSATKGSSGWSGRLACAAHVLTYTITAVAALVALVAVLDVELHLAAAAGGLAISAITHYIADRRAPLRWLADALGSKGDFYRVNSGGINGAYLLDQSWHIAWLFVAALVIA